MTLGPLMVDIAGAELSSSDCDVLRHPLIGGVILFTRNFADPEQLAALTAAIHALRRPPLLVAVDQEGGRVQRFRNPLTRLPPARAIGARYQGTGADAQRLARECGWLMAAELRALGVDLSFAPVVDIDHGVSEVIGDRAYHQDPDVVAELAAAWMSGMHAAGMAATAKHFPGHGAIAADSHHVLPVDRRSVADLSDDLRPFRRVIDAGVEAVMMALVEYPAVDPVPAVFSSRWIRATLREEMGFRGAVFSDDLSMGGAVNVGSMPQRTVRALEAGCDMAIICNDRVAVEQVLNEVDIPSNPAGQARLASLHGRRAESLAGLRETARWRSASDSLARMSATSDEPPRAGRG